jgi:hypothetical protein
MAKKQSTVSAPTRTLWFVALIIGFLGILGHYVQIDILSKYNYEMLLVGFILLVIGTTFRGA